MVFAPILQKFSDKSPVTVMVQGLLEHLLHKEKIDAWFGHVSEVQYTKNTVFFAGVYHVRSGLSGEKKRLFSVFKFKCRNHSSSGIRQAEKCRI